MKADLHKITVPTLSIGATHDTMDPEQMKFISEEVQNGRFYYVLMGVTFHNLTIKKSILRA